MNASRTALLTALLLGLATPPAAETIRVPDDQATIQAAVDAATESGDIVVIGPGNFNGFTVTDRDVLQVIGEPGHLIAGDVNVTGGVNIRLAKLRVEGSITIADSEFSIVTKCRVFGGTIAITEASNDLVRRNRVENPEIGIQVTGSAFHIERNLVVAPAIIGILGIGSGTLKGNKVEGGDFGIGADEGPVKILRNQIVDVSVLGIQIKGENHVVRGNEVLGAGDDGIQCFSGGSNRFEGNLVKRVNDGFDIKEACPNNEIIDNRVKNVNSDGIDLESDGNLVKKNFVKGTAAVGIELNGTGNTVVKNTIRNNGEGALRDDLGGNTLGGNICDGDPDGCN